MVWRSNEDSGLLVFCVTVMGFASFSGGMILRSGFWNFFCFTVVFAATCIDFSVFIMV
jgi:hypothetical protein